MDQVHQQEGEIVEHVPGCDHGIEFDGVEQGRFVLDENDISEMQIAMASPDQTFITADDHQPPHRGEIRAARLRQGIYLLDGKYVGPFAQSRVVLFNIGGDRLDPRFPRRHGRVGMRRGDDRAKAGRKAGIELAARRQAIERPALVETCHLNYPLDRPPLPAQRQPPVGLARHRHHTAIQ